MSFQFSDVSTQPIANLISLNGRAALGAGGAQGLGRAIAERRAEAEETI